MSKIAIRPYVSQSKHDDNMGLQKAKQVLFEGTSYKVDMWMKEDVAGSACRAITGLNEFAPELNQLPPEEKEAKIKEIRKTVAMLEGVLASNQLDVNDKKFWEKVQRVRPDNIQFWSGIQLTLSNIDIFLDPTDVTDIIRIFSIEAGGFPEVAPNFEAARSGQKKYKFYLDKFDVTVKETTKLGIMEDRAKVILLEMFEGNINKLNLVCKAIDANSTQYKKSTPIEVLYGNMREFIEGIVAGVKLREAGNAKRFIEVAKLDMETLKLRAVVKDSTFYNFLVVRSGQIYEAGVDTAMGYGIPEVVEFLKNPLNDAVLQRLLKRVEQYWNM